MAKPATLYSFHADEWEQVSTAFPGGVSRAGPVSVYRAASEGGGLHGLVGSEPHDGGE